MIWQSVKPTGERIIKINIFLNSLMHILENRQKYNNKYIAQ